MVRNKSYRIYIFFSISCSYLSLKFCFRSYFILNKQVLKSVKVASINFHPGPPNFRGFGCLNFALLNNAKQYGCTAHLINIKIEVFNQEKLIDITTHRYFSPHEKIEGEEEQQIREKYGDNLPKLFANDAVVCFFGFNIGDIIKITRKDGIVYRLIIEKVHK